MSKLALTHATVIYNQGTSSELTALAGVDLFIAAGEFVSIIGNNGSGKSTLLKVIAGTVPLQSGKVWVDKKNVTEHKAFRRLREVSMVCQSANDSLAVGMTVQENLILASLKLKRLSLRLPKAIGSEAVEKLHALGFDLTTKLNVPVRELSGGQKQLLSLAMAVIQQPKILLLDEHTAALDPANRELINELTLKIAQENDVTILMVSHSLSDALKMGDRLVVLNEGRIKLDADRQQKIRLDPSDIAM